MFKLVVLSALLAVAACKPSLIHEAPLALSVAAPAVAVPSAVSYQARTDVISKPVVATVAAAAPVVAAYSAPAVAAYSAPAVAAYSAPAVAAYSAPAIAAYSAPAVAVPSAVSYQARTDIVNKPVVATYAAAAPALAYSAPALAHGAVLSAPALAHGAVLSAPALAHGAVLSSPSLVKSIW